MKQVKIDCPSCGSQGLQVFYEVRQVPVHSVLLMSSRDMAVNYRKGDISLGFCRACSFVSNTAFDATVHEYSSKYEETQGFSPTFNVFHQELAQTLINEYFLRGKTIIEIGCGKGDFLNLICELGDNEGIGFDPAYLSERDSGAGNAKVRFIQDFYSEKYSSYESDFVCCKMTLEQGHKFALAASDFQYLLVSQIMSLNQGHGELLLKVIKSRRKTLSFLVIGRIFQ